MPIARNRHSSFSPARAVAGTLIDIAQLATNPGALAGQLYLPEMPAPDAPLIVVLHGCTQNGVHYAEAAGWLDVADRHGLAILIPQQQRANNANLCFNWFEGGDTTRNQGEAASIKAMIDWTCAHHAIDPARIFVTGLSAGAAMASAMLATYPEIFAGGGLIAGLPYGVATSVQTALQQMHGSTRETGYQLAHRVQAASGHSGRWPRVSVWHGSADRTVSAANGEASVAQWLAVHGLDDQAPALDTIQGHGRRSWSAADSDVRVEHIDVKGMGHGTPIDPRGDTGVGRSAPFVLDVGLSSSEHLLDFWKVAPASTAHRAAPDLALGIPPKRPNLKVLPTLKTETGVEKVINDALRAAGLMR